MMNEYKKRIQEMLQEKQWTFADMQDMASIVDEFAGRLYGEMSATEKLDYVWEEIGADFQRILSTKLKEEVAIQVKELLMNANINFNQEEDKNEVPKRSVGRKPSKKRPTNEKTNSKE
tara:strand:- start:554 stop:907 length:354 start_codon:yes stop_codon:yes gene_type:complete